MTHTAREILTTFQHLVIGLVALVVVLQWYAPLALLWQILVWIIVAGGLSLLRIILIVATEWFRDTRWQTIRRRNWD